MIESESELSYLVKRLPDLTGVRFDEIEQHYLDDSPDALRLRSRGQKFELTKKTQPDPNDFSRKEEQTLLLDGGSFQALRSSFKRRLTKTRYYFRLEGGLVAEIDVFHEALKGLVMVEVEFPDEQTRAKFVPPDWFGRDVSQEPWSSNAFLAGKSFQDIEQYLKG